PRAGALRDRRDRREPPRVRGQGRARAVVDRVPRGKWDEQPVPADAQRGQLPGERRDRRRHQLRRLLLSGGARSMRGSAMSVRGAGRGRSLVAAVALAAIGCGGAASSTGRGGGGGGGSGGSVAGSGGAAGASGAGGGAGAVGAGGSAGGTTGGA